MHRKSHPKGCQPCEGGQGLVVADVAAMEIEAGELPMLQDGVQCYASYGGAGAAEVQGQTAPVPAQDGSHLEEEQAR